MTKPELHAAREGKGDVKPAATPSSAYSSSAVVASLTAVVQTGVVQTWRSL